MNCSDVSRLLSRLSDDDLPDRVRRQAVAHLDRCAACAARDRELHALGDLIRAVSHPEPNPYLWTRVASAINAPPVEATFSVSEPVGFGLLAAAAAAVVLAVFSVLAPVRESRSTPSGLESMLLVDSEPRPPIALGATQDRTSARDSMLSFVVFGPENGAQKGASDVSEK